MRLAKLEALGLTARLERRIGGVRAGSSGTVWRDTVQGRRALKVLSGEPIGTLSRLDYEPGRLHVAHTLAVAELYVRLVEAERAGQLDLIEFEHEPKCWRAMTGPLGQSVKLKPDAFAAVGVGAYEERVFIEVDRGTHGSVALARKRNRYRGYERSGIEQGEFGVFPRVLWLVETTRRLEVVQALLDELPSDVRQSQQVLMADDFVRVLIRQESAQEPWERGDEG